MCFNFSIPHSWFQRGGGHQTGRTECFGDEAAAGAGGEVCLPSRGQPNDEAYHQLALQKQRGERWDIY